MIAPVSRRWPGDRLFKADRYGADIEVADLLEAMADDPATTVVSLYLETIRDVEKFRKAATRVIGAVKSIIAYKVGRSETGAQSAAPQPIPQTKVAIGGWCY